jgi:hypothetical protein
MTWNPIDILSLFLSIVTVTILLRTWKVNKETRKLIEQMNKLNTKI